MRNLGMYILLSLVTLKLLAAGGDRIAFLKGNHVFVADADGKNASQIDKDPRRKARLRWDAVHGRFGFLTDPTGGELSRFVTMDLAGKILAEAAIRPPTNPPTQGMRFVESLEWLPNGKIRLGGSVNPWNCEQFDQDPATGKTSNGVFGKCGSFVPSPDGKHMAKLDTVAQSDDEHAFDTVLVDEGPSSVHRSSSIATVSYWGDSHLQGIFVLAGPAWSPDSKEIAVIERRSSDQQFAVVIFTPADKPGEEAEPQGRVRSFWIPAATVEDPSWPSLQWIGSKVVAGQGDRSVSVDSLDPRALSLAATSDLKVELARRERARTDAAASAVRTAAMVRQLGGSEGLQLAQKGATQ